MPWASVVHHCQKHVRADLNRGECAGESAGLRVPSLDRCSAFFACHGALLRNDIARPPGVFLQDGDDSLVLMGRYTAPKAQELSKCVAMRRRGTKPHPTSLAALETSPDAQGMHCDASACLLM